METFQKRIKIFYELSKNSKSFHNIVLAMELWAFWVFALFFKTSFLGAAAYFPGFPPFAITPRPGFRRPPNNSPGKSDFLVSLKCVFLFLLNYSIFRPHCGGFFTIFVQQ